MEKSKQKINNNNNRPVHPNIAYIQTKAYRE